MSCPLCQQRRGRRRCPAVRQVICPTCCGSKRQVEISCPADCPYLASAHAHPAASVRRQQEADAAFVLAMTDGLDQAQADLLLAVLGFVAGLRADPLLTLTDDDVADGAAAVSATLETAERGLIYEHRPQSLPAQRFVNDIKGFLAGLAAGADASAARRLEQNAAVVLRRLEQGLRGARAAGDQGPAAGLGIIGRFMAAARAAGLAAGREGKPIIETPSSLLVKP